MKNYVISLKSTPERLETFLKNNFHMEFEVFEAVDGSTLTPVGAYKHGGMGNAMSHIELWKKCVELNEPITICEDDALLHSKFKMSCHIALMHEPYDFICWGWNFDAHLWASPDPFLSPVQMIFNQDIMRNNKQGYLKTPVHHVFMKLHLFNGTFCYTISPKGAKRFLEICYPLKPVITAAIPQLGQINITPAGLDSAMPEAYQQTYSVVCFPPLALCDNDHSTSTVQK